MRPRRPKLLHLVKRDHPVLRRKADPIRFPLSDGDRELIESMKFSIQKEQLEKAKAPWSAAVGMAANQWGVSKRIFLYCPDGDTAEGLEVIINPSYEVITDDEGMMEVDQAWEGCFSVPLATGHVERPFKIRATYRDTAGKAWIRELEGWPARVWQHENDHLDGHLYVEPQHGTCLEFHQFETRAEVDAFYESLREKDEADDDASEAAVEDDAEAE